MSGLPQCPKLLTLSLCLLSALALIACDDDPSVRPESDLGPDTSTDTVEVTPDLGQDLPPELPEDLQQDLPPDSVDPDLIDLGDLVDPDLGDFIDVPTDLPSDFLPDADAIDPDLTEVADIPDDEVTTPTSVIANWDFEFWQDGLPTMWFGSVSNLESSSVVMSTTNPYSGQRACTLINTGSTHRRFTTTMMSLPAGRYACTFAARGQGEIRAGAYIDGDYRYGSYTTLDQSEWKLIDYTFNLALPAVENMAFMFSLRNTTGNHITVDTVICERQAAPCDTVVCQDWEQCNPSTAVCEPQSGRCNLATDCLAWETCDANHTCVLAAGRCNTTADCPLTSATPVCDRPTHTCVAGDPCAGVTCDAWKACEPNTGTCVLSAGRCVTTADCLGNLPACDTATHTCVSAEHPANIFPNGGFESWDTYYLPYLGEHYIPDDWYGTFEDLNDATGATELHPSFLAPYTAHPHSGTRALQIIQTITTNADRFASEDFDIPAGTYTCAYWVRGKGHVRHRWYSTGGWSTQTPFEVYDTETWTRVLFNAPGNVRYFRLLFYVSNTDPAKDHIQIDSVVCTKN